VVDALLAVWDRLGGVRVAGRGVLCLALALALVVVFVV
jgi:hypothetical protein